MGESASKALTFAALLPPVAVFAMSVIVGLDALSPGPDVYVEDGTVVALEAVVVAHLIVVGYVIWSLVRILRGEGELWWRTGCAYVLATALTYVVWLLWVRHFSGG